MIGVAALLLAASASAPLSLQAKGDDSLVPALVHALEGAGRRVVADAPVLVSLTVETGTRIRIEAHRGERHAEAHVQLDGGPTFERARTLALHCLALVQEIEKPRPQPARRPPPKIDPSPPEPAQVVSEPPAPRAPVVFSGVVGTSSIAAPKPAAHVETPSTDIPVHALSVEPVLLAPLAPEWIREHYPMGARVEEVESTVLLELHLDAGGAVRDTVLLEVQRPGFGFESAARTLAKRLRFTPAKLGRKAVPTRIVMTIRFELP